MNKQDVLKVLQTAFTQYVTERDAQKVFVPGETVVQYAGSYFDENEYNAALEILVNGWLGLAEKGLVLEGQLSERLGKDYGFLANSGSSANLLAVATVCSLNFPNHLKPGDEVITAACGFPTTINPLIQYQLVPVFVDVELGNYNIKLSQLEEALSEKTRAVMFAHTLGNPADMDVIVDFCKKNNLILIEDCCDALGSTYDGKPAGSFGDFATLSMYPSHHITIGEGGLVATNNQSSAKIIRALRDWGRDCWCAGQASLLPNGSCNKRFSKWLDGIDEIVDHKYVYGEIGYNIKPIELQAAIGVEQLKKLDFFIERRRHNFMAYYEFFKQYEEWFILPDWQEKADPSWFAFPLTVKDSAPFKKSELTQYLENKRIQTRNLFAGNILRHPAYKNIKHRVVGSLENSDKVISNTFFIGVYPGITKEMLDYVILTLSEYLEAKK